MSVLASLNDHVGTLVHPTARGLPLDYTRHKSFILTRLLLSLAALVLVPPCLVAGSTPALWQVGALGWLMLPFAAAVYVSRTGDLPGAEALSVTTWIGLSTTVAAGSGSPQGLALLLVVALEAAVSSSSPASSRLVACSAGVAAGVALALVLTGNAHVQPQGARCVFGMIAGSVAYGMLLTGAAGYARANAERQAAARDARLRLLTGLSADVLLFLDGSGAVVDGGEGAELRFAIKPRDLAGRGLFERILVSDRPQFLQQVAAAAAGHGPNEGIYRLRTGRTAPGGEGVFEAPVFAYVEVKARACPAGFPGGDAGGVAGTAVAIVLRDISIRKLSEQAADEAEAAARRSHAGRDRFLATVSHELRTPLNAIIGFSEVLSNDALVPRDAGKRREYAGIIHQSGQHLLAVVNTILDASKIEAGSFAIEPEPLDLGAMVESCVGMVGLRAEQAGVRLEKELPLGLGDVVADDRACKQIVLNLLSNALKFTPAGGRVTVAVRPDGNSVLITVADTGIGIHPRDLPRLGSPFFQARDGIDRDRDGTGLGLSVVRGLVGLHGGSIVIESAPGQGTRVTVCLPRDCRRLPAQPRIATRIETVPRYPSSAAGDGRLDVVKAYHVA